MRLFLVIYQLDSGESPGNMLDTEQFLGTYQFNYYMYRMFLVPDHIYCILGTLHIYASIW